MAPGQPMGERHLRAGGSFYARRRARPPASQAGGARVSRWGAVAAAAGGTLGTPRHAHRGTARRGRFGGARQAIGGRAARLAGQQPIRGARRPARGAAGRSGAKWAGLS